MADGCSEERAEEAGKEEVGCSCGFVEAGQFGVGDPCGREMREDARCRWRVGLIGAC
jgi:hypothetical protein